MSRPSFSADHRNCHWFSARAIPLQRASSWSNRLSRRALLLSIALLAVGNAAAREPSVADLVSVCDRALAQGNKGLDAAMCEWFAAPCECKVGRSDGSAARWCVPDGESIDGTVEKVLVRLRRYPDQSAEAAAVVPGLLAEIYPCPPSESP